jgi:hypothetical protein
MVRTEVGMKGKYQFVLERDPIVNVEIAWYKTFALLPHRTIGNRWVWMEQCYKRIVWRGTFSFHIEPFSEYATLFEILAQS